jgi:hypothetical protein
LVIDGDDEWGDVEVAAADAMHLLAGEWARHPTGGRLRSDILQDGVALDVGGRMVGQNDRLVEFWHASNWKTLS